MGKLPCRGTTEGDGQAAMTRRVILLAHSHHIMAPCGTAMAYLAPSTAASAWIELDV